MEKIGGCVFICLFLDMHYAHVVEGFGSYRVLLDRLVQVTSGQFHLPFSQVGGSPVVPDFVMWISCSQNPVEGGNRLLVPA